MEIREGTDRGAALARISERIVRLLKDYYGRGPTKAKTYYQDDLVVVLMRGGFTKVEDTLLTEGRGDSVMQQRMAFQEVMRPRFAQVIEEELGRKVLGFMSGSHQEPDLTAEIFTVESENGGEFLANAQAGDG